ncbi:MAG: GspE/PulE family protein [Campylobacterota bacterium]|nr:GspE/PulE family protein [Campylobacterota bacterium]
MKLKNLYDYNIEYDLLNNIDINLLKEYKFLPILKDTLYILVATSDENLDVNIVKNILKQPIKLIYINKDFLELSFLHLDFQKKLFLLASKSLSISKNDKNSYIIEFMDELFKFCIKNNGSDIHIEALDKSVIIRFRIDGDLNQLFSFKIKLYPIISSIIKYFASLDISQKRLPLDGRFSRYIYENNYDFRVSTLPTIYGESIVLRILDNKNINKELENIGFDDNELDIIKTVLPLTSGMILVTGPTGSGKTTTLYSMLKRINKNSKKIITVEDPVEYKLKGIMQVNVNTDIGLDYTTVLKNILRQDPDIIMIGEIRDSQSLQIAIQASLTGHLVIATLHTNSATETITRLFDMGAKSYLIANTLKLILSQRLVRVLCKYCKGAKCKECNLTGYNSRAIVSEALKFDENISKMVSKQIDVKNILDYAIDNNSFQTIQSNGMKLVNNNITSLEEYYAKI